MKYRRLFLPTLLLIFFSCSSPEETSTCLADVESYIEERPDSALVVLDSIGKDGIRGRKAKAKHALLYSMALDKNYIDITNDSIINVAVNWYKRHGTADEKLKSYYYQGVVRQNSGDKELAMDSYIKAERFAENATDHLALGRLYKAQYVIHHYIYDFDKGIGIAKKSAMHFLAAQDTNKYIGALEDIAENYLIQNNSDSCSTYIEKISEVLNYAAEHRKGRYYEIAINYYRDRSEKMTLAVIQECLEKVHPEHINWATIAYTYLSIGDTDSAVSAINNYPIFDPDYKNSPNYYVALAAVKENTGQYDEALEAYKQYIAITDSQDMDIFNHNIKSVRDNYKHEMDMARQHLLLAITIMGIIIVILFSILINARIRREKEKYEDLYYKAIVESDMLRKRIDEGNSTQATKAIIHDRLNLLNKFITAYITDSIPFDKKTLQELEKTVSDKEQFINSTRITFENSFPNFMKYLSEKKLTDKELNYCCLYLLGLNGKEIGNYIGLQRHYIKYAQPIRAKLGLGEHDKNLGPYLIEQSSKLQ